MDETGATRRHDLIMRTNLAQRLVAVVGIAMWLMLANMSWAAEKQQFQQANGLAVYIGVLPAGMTMRHSPGGPPRKAHGGAPTWGQQYHVIVAIFDNASGERVTDAKVSAAVSDATLPGRRVSGPEKILDPMQIAEGTVYGNYFNMPAPTPYRIEVKIRRQGSAEAVKAAFDYRHAVVTGKPPS